MSLKGSMPVRFHDTAASAAMPGPGARTSKRRRDNAFRWSTGRQAGKGCFDCVVVCFAHDNFAQDDSARHGTGDGYRFLGEFRAGATRGLLTGTIAPFDGSAAALALVSTS